MKTVEAHSHFVSTLAWGRQPAGGASDKKVNGAEGGGAGGDAGVPEKVVNVVATGSVDQTIKIWLP